MMKNILTVIGLLLVALLGYLAHYYFDRAPYELSEIKRDIVHLHSNQDIFRSDIDNLKLSVNGILIMLARLHDIDGKNFLVSSKMRAKSNEDIIQRFHQDSVR